MVLKLGEAGAVHLLVSPQVIRELEGALRRKAPRAMGALALILDRSAVEITETPSEAAVQNALKLVDHGGDERILAAVLAADADYFITLDKEHFLENRAVREATPIPIGTPGDFLSWYRRRIRSL
jgi:predicted nucleic acid-binding protein